MSKDIAISNALELFKKWEVDKGFLRYAISEERSCFRKYTNFQGPNLTEEEYRLLLDILCMRKSKMIAALEKFLSE